MSFGQIVLNFNSISLLSPPFAVKPHYTDRERIWQLRCHINELALCFSMRWTDFQKNPVCFRIDLNSYLKHKNLQITQPYKKKDQPSRHTSVLPPAWSPGWKWASEGSHIPSSKPPSERLVQRNIRLCFSHSPHKLKNMSVCSAWKSGYFLLFTCSSPGMARLTKMSQTCTNNITCTI